MNNFVIYANFTLDRDIPNIEKDIDGFNAYITKYQKEVLIKLLGYDLYKAFETGLAEETPEDKWTDLRDGSTYEVNDIKHENPGCVDIVAYYVYCKWLSDNWEQLTGVGVGNSVAENAVIVSPENKMTKAWNKMVENYYMTYDFIIQNESDYPNLDFTDIGLMTYF